MHGTCAICGDVFVPDSSISAPECGHTFHTECILQWLERSKTCPHCRSKATARSVVKLYFTKTSDETQNDDPSVLQLQIDSLKLQVRMRETEISGLKEDNAMISKQNQSLRDHCKSVEKKLKDKETTNLALKAQLKYADKLKLQADTAVEKSKTLEAQLQLFMDVQTTISGSNEEVEAILKVHNSGSADIKKLATMCSLLKRELSKTSDEKNAFRDQCKSLNRELKDIKSSYSTVCRKLQLSEQVQKSLQEDILSLENENKNLRKKLVCLEEAIASPSGNIKNSALHRLIAESPAPEELKTEHSSSSNDDILIITPEVVRKMGREEKKNDPNESVQYIETTENLPKKQKIALPGRKPFRVATNLPEHAPSHNIFVKKKITSTLDLSTSPLSSVASGSAAVGYDGLGGHHKVDEFPIPKPSCAPKGSNRKYRHSNLKVTSKSGALKFQTTNLVDYFQKTFEDS